MTNGSDPVAPGGGHNSQAGAGFDAAAADDAEDGVPAEPPVPAPERAARLEPPAVDALVLAAVVAVELVVNAAAIAGKLTAPYWVDRVVPATAVVVAMVCAVAGVDKATNSDSAMRVVPLGIPTLR